MHLQDVKTEVWNDGYPLISLAYFIATSYLYGVMFPDCKNVFRLAVCIEIPK